MGSSGEWWHGPVMADRLRLGYGNLTLRHAFLQMGLSIFSYSTTPASTASPLCISNSCTCTSTIMWSELAQSTQPRISHCCLGIETMVGLSASIDRWVINRNQLVTCVEQEQVATSHADIPDLFFQVQCWLVACIFVVSVAGMGTGTHQCGSDSACQPPPHHTSLASACRSLDDQGALKGDLLHNHKHWISCSITYFTNMTHFLTFYAE